MFKKIKTKLVDFLATHLGWLLIDGLCRSMRVTILNRSYWDEMIAGGRGFIALLWHGRFLLPIFVHRHLGVVAMISEHRDGELIARTVEKLGYRTVRGSSTRGGRRAFRAMLGHLRQGAICTIIPDGPRGPRHYLKPGALLMARMADVPVLPILYSASRKIVTRSWDRFVIPAPFSRGVLIYGQPTHIPADADSEQLEILRQQIERQMIQLEEEADAYFRH